MSGYRRIDEHLIRACLAPRVQDSHKGTYGHLLALVGSYGMAGAARFCVEGAYRCGVGLVTAAVPTEVVTPLTTAVPEALVLPLSAEVRQAEEALTAGLDNKTAAVIGCGLGKSEYAAALLERVLPLLEVPTVLDADGINWLAAHTDIRETVTAPLCLTPHPAEMARLLDCTVAEVQADRRGAARKCADRYAAVVVLKGHQTVIASPHEPTVLLNPTGNDGMAVGGSGDVLAGMIASFAAQGMTVAQAAACGVYLHGLAGDAAAAKLSRHGMLPRDLLQEIGPLFLRYE